LVFYAYVNEGVFTLASVTFKFGIGASNEVGFEASKLGLRRVLLITDRNLWRWGLLRRL